MSNFDLMTDMLKFYIPMAFAIAFHAFGLGYSTKTRLVLGFAVYTAYMVLAPSLFIAVTGYGTFTHTFAPVLLLGGFAVMIFTTDTPGKTIFLQLVESSAATALLVLIYMVRIVFELPYAGFLLLLTLAGFIAYAVARHFWAEPLRFIVDHVDDLHSVLVLPVVTLAAVSLIPIYPPHNFAGHPIFCTGIILAMELGFFLYIYMLYCNLQRLSILSGQEMKNELLQSEITSYQAFLETARQNRHDLRHHDSLIMEQLAAGDVEGAKKYLLAHSEAMNETSIRQFCHNITANAVLRLYERRAQEQGVTFSVMADIPQELPLTAPELGGLLGNLLENAMEACWQYTGMNDYIIFNAEVEEEDLLLEVRNTAPANTVFQNGFPVSQKPGGGIGTRSIVNTLKKHGGMVSFFQEGTEFSARIILPL